MERYRSGRNGADSKSAVPLKAAPWVRIPPSPPGGEMPELAEGARLEIVRAAKKRHRGFESLSLRQFI